MSEDDAAGNTYLTVFEKMRTFTSRRLLKWRLFLPFTLAVCVSLLTGGRIHAFDIHALGEAHEQASALTQEAFAAYENGDYPRALGLIDQAERLHPDQADAYNLRGVIYLKQGAYDKAGAAFSRAVALDPDLWAAKFNEAEVPFRQKNYARARQLFDRLASQTNRYKDAREWELVLYKAVLSSLLAGDEPGAMKRLAKLPAPGTRAATPASVYAQAAIAFIHKDRAAGEKLLASVRDTFSPAASSLFLTPLEAVGWVAAPQAPSLTAMPSTGSRMTPGLTILPMPLPVPGGEPDLPTGGSAPTIIPVPLPDIPGTSPAPDRSAPVPSKHPASPEAPSPTPPLAADAGVSPPDGAAPSPSKHPGAPEAPLPTPAAGSPAATESPAPSPAHQSSEKPLPVF